MARRGKKSFKDLCIDYQFYRVMDDKAMDDYEEDSSLPKSSGIPRNIYLRSKPTPEDIESGRTNKNILTSMMTDLLRHLRRTGATAENYHGVWRKDSMLAAIEKHPDIFSKGRLDRAVDKRNFELMKAVEEATMKSLIEGKAKIGEGVIKIILSHTGKLKKEISDDSKAYQIDLKLED